MGSTEQLYNLTWGEFNNSLSATVQSLRCHGDLVDVTLTAGGKIFPAHKLVLGAASPLLMELLKSTKCEHPVVMLAGITASDLEALLQFVYHGEVSVDPTQLPSLLQAAQCLNIQALSPSILSIDKNGQPMLAPFHDTRPMISPFVSVRKKRKKSNPPNEEGVSDPSTSKEQNKSDGPKRTPLVSDLPVSCTICGVTLRQSRNLRRHMELMHLKPASERKQKVRRPNDAIHQSVDNNPSGSQAQMIGHNGQTQTSVEGNGLTSSDSRVTEVDGRLTEQRLLDHRLPDRGSQTCDTRQDQALGHFSSPGVSVGASLCEPIIPFLHIDPAYIGRPADLYRHQQA